MANKRPTAKMISFARNVIAGQAPSEALRNSLYDVSGYSTRGLAVFAQELLRHPIISSAITKAHEEVLRGGRLVREDALALLENIAEANIGDFLTFESEVVTDSQGRTRKVMLLEAKDADQLTPDQLACIQEISEGQNGKIRIKLKSATDAIKQLTALHGWNAAPKAAVGQDGKDVPPAVVQITREVVEGGE